MKKPKWGPRDIAALRKLTKLHGSQRKVAEHLVTTETSVSRWLNGNSPRNVEAIRLLMAAR